MWLVIIPMTIKLCLRGKTFNIHDLQVCKQPQALKIMFMVITWLGLRS